MQKEDFVQNVKTLCLMRGLRPTSACREAGVGTSFLSDINRGQTPSVAKVQLLATYLGVTTSELLGEVPPALGGDLSAGELELVLSYRAATADDKAVVDTVLRKYKKVPAKKTGAAG